MALSWSAWATVQASLFQTSQTARLNDLLAASDKLQSGDLVGEVSIPRIALSVIVIEGDDHETLAAAAGHIPGTAVPWGEGNVGVAAHRDTFFRNLRRVRTGDLILFRTPRGDHRYRVTHTSIVAPENVEVLRSSKRQELTLVTCYPFRYIGPAPKRFIVHAAQTGG
jgi:sortase A